MPEPEPPEPRSGISAAGWTAISAIAVAVIGAIVTLTTTWWQHAPAKEPPPAAAAAATTAEPASTAPPPASIPHSAAASLIPAGRWSGTAREPGARPFPVEVVLLPGCAMNSPCGTIAVPAVPCRGRITMIDAGPDGFEFQVDRFDATSSADCKPGAGEVLRALDDGTLAYTATYSGAKGVLKPVG